VGRSLALGPALAGPLFVSKDSRHNELEADAFGVQYMARVGYNPVGQIQVMEILREASGGGGGPEWLSTHPAPDTRISDLEQLITSEFPQATASPPVYRMGDNEFKQNILVPLSQLPPARHPAQQQGHFLNPDNIEQVTGLTWDEVLHRSCACHPVRVESE